jgi:hypothetical protein
MHLVHQLACVSLGVKVVREDLVEWCGNTIEGADKTGPRIDSIGQAY